MVLLGVEEFMGKTDREGGTTVCCSGNGSSRKDVGETAVLKEQFVELTTSGIWEEKGKMESDERFGNVSSSRGAEGSGGLSLATGDDAKLVGGAGWIIGNKLDTGTGLIGGAQIIGASQKQE